jgi:hypothetical protein
MGSHQNAHRRLGTTTGVAAIGYLLTVAAALGLGQASGSGWWRMLSWAAPTLVLVVVLTRTLGGRLSRLEQA